MNIFKELLLISSIIIFLSYIFIHMEAQRNTPQFNIIKLNICIFIVSLCVMMVGTIGECFYNPKSLDEQYNEKLKNIENAEKDLQKFLIEYPQFKEEK